MLLTAFSALQPQICFWYISLPLVSSFSFFFSSRRRHTRFKCDWSSDVSSSDLVCRLLLEIGKTQVLTPVTLESRMPSFDLERQTTHHHSNNTIIASRYFKQT